MARFPWLPLLAILASVVSYLIVQISLFAYAGFMVRHLNVVSGKDQAGEIRTVATFYAVATSNKWRVVAYV